MSEKNDIFFRCVENCSEAIMITDEKPALTYVNPAWLKTYGYTKNEVIGKSPAILRSGLQDKSFYAKMWEEIKKDGQWKGELVNRAKDGNLVPVILTITDYHDDNGKTKGYLGIAVDITSKKQLEAEVIHQDRLASVGILASGLAHEVGTPLGVIRGRAEFLQMETKPESAAHRALDVVIAQIDRISHLISTLLSFSRSSSDLNIKSNFLLPLIDEVILLINEKLSKEQIQLAIDIQPNTRITCDYNRLQQILINLIINSIHAIESSTHQNNKKMIRISLVSNNRSDTLVIEDTGCGISPENLKKIFHPFFTTKDIGKGTGLGLAIVSKLANEMNAQIIVDSTVGEGTTFSLVFLKN